MPITLGITTIVVPETPDFAGSPTWKGIMWNFQIEKTKCIKQKLFYWQDIIHK